MGTKEFFQDRRFAADGFFLAVQFHHDHGAQSVETFAAGPAAGGGQGKLIGDLQGGGQKPGGENGADGAGGGGHGIKPNDQQRLKRGQRNEFQGGFCHHAQQSFGTDKQSGEIEAGFVFMGAPAHLDDGAAGQHDF